MTIISQMIKSRQIDRRINSTEITSSASLSVFINYYKTASVSGFTGYSFQTLKHDTGISNDIDYNPNLKNIFEFCIVRGITVLYTNH